MKAISLQVSDLHSPAGLHKVQSEKSLLSTAGTRNYVVGIEYLGANLDAIYHAEGRCTPNGATAF